MQTQVLCKPIHFPGFKIRSEGFNLLFWLAAFLACPFLLRMIDRSAAPLDPGILSLVLVAIFSGFLFQAITWSGIQLIWPTFTNFSRYSFDFTFKLLTPWQKVITYLGFYLALLFSFVLCLCALA